MFGSTFIQACLEKYKYKTQPLPAFFLSSCSLLPPPWLLGIRLLHIKAVTGDGLIDDVFLSLQSFLLGLPRTEGKQQPDPRKLPKAADNPASLTKREIGAGRQGEEEVAWWVLTACLLHTAGMWFCRKHGPRAILTCAKRACTRCETQGPANSSLKVFLSSSSKEIHVWFLSDFVLIFLRCGKPSPLFLMGFSTLWKPCHCSTFVPVT